MQFTSEQRLDDGIDGILEREFTLGEIPGTLWTPASAAPAPLILMAHNNGLPKKDARLVARARHIAAQGYAAATIDAAATSAPSRRPTARTSADAATPASRCHTPPSADAPRRLLAPPGLRFVPPVP